MTITFDEPEAERSERTPHPWVLATVIGLFALVVGAGIGFVLGQGSDAESGADVSEAVMTAWATKDPDDIRAIYADDAVFVFDGEPVATGIDEITQMIGEVENTYETVGPVTSYGAADGDVYVSALVEVVGPAHPVGVPVAVVYRVRDGEVIRHVVMDAEHY